MLETVTRFIKRHQLITKGTHVLVGVSGGPDSMALLHLLCSIRRRWDINITAISIDHQLRGQESGMDLTYVREICRKWNVSFIGEVIDVKEYQKMRGIGTELAARELRYQVYEKQMISHQADYLLLGHHADDQIETMLMRLTKTASPKALAGIPYKRPFAGGYIVRPLLCVTKDDLETYCSKNNIHPRYDQTNDDTIYTRNYYRKMILPLIKAQNHNIHTTIQHLSEALRSDEQYLDEQAHLAFKRVVTLKEESHTATFQIDVFIGLPTTLQRRIFHLLLNYLYNELPKDITYIHVDQLFALLTSKRANIHLDFPRNLKVKKAYQTITFSFQIDQQLPVMDTELCIPGVFALADGAVLSTSFTQNKVVTDANCFTCPRDEVALPLHIRTRKPGDRMSWNGLNGTKKIKDIFIDGKIPLEKRDSWPIITDNNDKVLWLVGLKKAKFKVQSNVALFVHICYKQGNI